MKINHETNYLKKTVENFQRGDTFIDPDTDDIMMVTDMSTGDDKTCLAVSLYWGTMQEYGKNEMVYDCIAEVNVTRLWSKE